MHPRLALLALITASFVRADTFTEPFSETHHLDPGGTVRIENTNGSISIKTWDRPEASITGEKSAGSQEELKHIVLEIVSEPGSLSIKTKFQDGDSDWSGLIGALF